VQKIAPANPRFAVLTARLLDFHDRRACFLPHQRLTPIEFLVGMRPVSIDIVQEHLDQRLSLVSVAPME
jgi:hypothetical protein